MATLFNNVGVDFCTKSIMELTDGISSRPITEKNVCADTQQEPLVLIPTAKTILIHFNAGGASTPQQQTNTGVTCVLQRYQTFLFVDGIIFY